MHIVAHTIQPIQTHIIRCSDDIKQRRFCFIISFAFIFLQFLAPLPSFSFPTSWLSAFLHIIIFCIDIFLSQVQLIILSCFSLSLSCDRAVGQDNILHLRWKLCAQVNSFPHLPSPVSHFPLPSYFSASSFELQLTVMQMVTVKLIDFIYIVRYGNSSSRIHLSALSCNVWDPVTGIRWILPISCFHKYQLGSCQDRLTE
jgi:hypothetical protein